MNAKWLVSFVLVSSPALGHEFWIEPSKFQPAAGEKVELRLRVGERFEGDPVVRKNERIKIFSFFGPQGNAPIEIPGMDGADPAGTIEIGKPGVYLVGYHNSPSRIELEAAKFEDYLKEDGLEAIIEEREKLGESQSPGKELYARCAKALIVSGPRADLKLDQRFGFPLEITPQSNPFAAKPGQEFVAKLLFHDKPIEGVKVSAIRRGESDKAVSARTDKEGLVRLRLDEPGLWLIAAVQMTRAELGTDADWQSLWASLTFENTAPPK